MTAEVIMLMAFVGFCTCSALADAIGHRESALPFAIGACIMCAMLLLEVLI
jgi:hypothetical protein